MRGNSHRLNNKAWAQRIIPLCLCGFVGVSLLSAHPAMAQNDTSSRLKRLENEIDTLSRAVYKGEKPPAAALGGTGAADAMGAVDARISQIEKDLQTLTGKVEQQSYDSQQAQQKLEVLEMETRRRLDEIEAQLRGGTATPTNVPPMMPQTDSQQQPPIDPNVVIGSDQPPMPSALQPDPALAEAGDAGSMDAAGLYEQGFAEIKREDYPAAEKSFAQFMKQYPAHALAPNALYWLGETFYVRKEYDKAARAFAEAYQKYPNGPKGADNLLKLGMSLAGKGEKDSACVALAQLRKEYPKGPEPVLKRGESESNTLGCP
jgi:tol-pal system protein YbgF